MARPVAYGQVYGGTTTVPIRTSASVPFQANSGRFVTLAQTTSRTATLASHTNTDLIGWADVGTFSTSSTVGQDVIPVIIDKDAVYEMPINATRSETQLQQTIGELTDLTMVSNIQYVGYTSSTYIDIQIVGYKYYGSGSGEQSYLVRLWEPNISVTTI